jgi:hypothetical protein
MNAFSAAILDGTGINVAKGQQFGLFTLRTNSYIVIHGINFRERSLNNPQFRCLHHHVFNTTNIRELLEAIGFRVDLIETALPFHLAVLASVPQRNSTPQNSL